MERCAVKMPGPWTSFWHGLTIFVLGRDRMDTQYAGWQQEYALYFGIHRPDEAKRAELAATVPLRDRWATEFALS